MVKNDLLKLKNFLKMATSAKKNFLSPITIVEYRLNHNPPCWAMIVATSSLKLKINLNFFMNPQFFFRNMFPPSEDSAVPQELSLHHLKKVIAA